MVRRILSTPSNGRGVEVEIDGLGSAELAPGNSAAANAWQPVADARSTANAQTRRAASVRLGAEITAVAAAGDVAYAGSADGRMWVSVDRGRTWNPARRIANGPIESLYVDAQAPRIALAAAGGTGAHVLRTTNTGGF